MLCQTLFLKLLLLSKLFLELIFQPFLLLPKSLLVFSLNLLQLLSSSRIQISCLGTLLTLSICSNGFLSNNNRRGLVVSLSRLSCSCTLLLSGGALCCLGIVRGELPDEIQGVVAKSIRESLLIVVAFYFIDDRRNVITKNQENVFLIKTPQVLNDDLLVVLRVVLRCYTMVHYLLTDSLLEKELVSLGSIVV